MEPAYRFPQNRVKLPPPRRLAKHTCPLSDPVNQHKLCRRRNDPPLSVCYGCKGEHLEGRKYYYYCDTCDLEFHRGCHVLPLEMQHPLHPSHPLILTSLDPSSGIDHTKIPHEWRESSSDSEVCEYDYISHDQGDDDETNIYYEKCKWCRKPLANVNYHCSVCNLSLHISCTTRPPPLNITNLKSHAHTLTLLPRRFPLPCDACGFSLDARDDVVYACLPCNHMVHRKCIYLPRVIKLTRHSHRLALIPSLHFGMFNCGVCRLTVDVTYGHYSCNKGCGYAVHSECATLIDVWDGKDLQDVPEEPEEDIESFVRIDEETIRHFTHDHCLVLHGKDSLHGNKKFCEACCLPISIHDIFYSCMQCNFALHEECAYLPHVKHHPIHKHPLILLKSSPNVARYVVAEMEGMPERKLSNEDTVCTVKGMFECKGCRRNVFGFVYSCREESCTYQVDVRCASLSDSSVHESHPHYGHELYFNLFRGECMVCKSTSCSRHYLECMICELYMGIHCATLPTVVYYKHHSLPLSLCHGDDSPTSDQYWCELCESKLDSSKWFYTCDSCGVTLHITCLLGTDMYMKPGVVINIGFPAYHVEFETVCNAGNSRPICNNCSRRCIETLVFKWVYQSQDYYICTYECLLRYT